MNASRIVDNELNDDELKRTRQGFFGRIKKALLGKSKVDEDVLDDLEEALISSDVGVDTTLKIIDLLKERASKNKYNGQDEIVRMIKEVILGLIADQKTPASESQPSKIAPSNPEVVLLLGVNGSGKTTTAGKLARKYTQQGRKVLLVAADTFRAAAIQQLEIWGKRAGVAVFSDPAKKDPSSVVYRSIEEAKVAGYDLIIVDTAGRMYNKANLMNELSKIVRTIHKLIPEGPRDTLLVIDGSVGQNAFHQAKEFGSITGVNGLIVTKLEGTAKGGMVIRICQELKMAVKYLGLGEGIEDLKDFSPREFIDSLFQREPKDPAV